MPSFTPARISVLAVCALLAACGGGGPDEQATPMQDNTSQLSNETNEDAAAWEAGTAASPPAAPESAQAMADAAPAGLVANAIDSSCSVIPAMPVPPSSAKKVTDYGATPDDDIDDTAKIQQALDSLAPGEWLVFPPGRYLQNKSIRARVQGTRLYGKGAELHASNPSSMAVMLSADDTGVYGFKLTAVTTIRMSTAGQARISVFKDDHTGKKLTAHNITIQGNTIVNAGAPGTPTANSASAAGILVSRASRFLVAQNTVVRSLADGIHVTDGSRDGRIMGNTVRETGDDLIGVVSYAQGGPAALNTSAGLLDILNSGAGLNKNILVEGNKLSNNYWGRGIGLIGGEAISIRNNTVSGVPGAGGILIAREHNWNSHGIDNVLVEYNTVHRIQNTTPSYNPGNKFAGVRTGHGVVEMHNFMFEDEYADPNIREKLSTKNVLIQKNTFRDSYPRGIRTGISNSGTSHATDPRTGARVGRKYRTGITKMTGIRNITFSNVNGVQLQTPGTETGSMSCSDLTMNGAAYTVANCVAAVPVVTGAALSNCASTTP